MVNTKLVRLNIKWNFAEQEWKAVEQTEMQYDRNKATHIDFY